MKSVSRIKTVALVSGKQKVIALLSYEAMEDDLMTVTTKPYLAYMDDATTKRGQENC